jgi:hypothetical protein
MFIELARGRRMPLRDARGKIALVPCELPNRKARRVAWLVIGGLPTIAMAIFLKDGWIVSSIVAVSLLLSYPFLVKEAMGDIAKERIVYRIRRGYCPWCNGELTPAADNELRRCRSCKAEWWDAVGIQPGISPKTQREHVLAIGIAAALSGIFFGFMGVGPIPTDPWKAVFIWEAVVLSIWLIASAFLARAHAPWWTMLFAAAPPAVWAIMLLSGRGHTLRGEALLIAALAFGTVGVLGGRFGRRFIRRDVRLHEGRLCAACGYDLRGCELGDPCPECQSPLRVR